MTPAAASRRASSPRASSSPGPRRSANTKRESRSPWSRPSPELVNTSLSAFQNDQPEVSVGAPVEYRELLAGRVPEHEDFPPRAVQALARLLDRHRLDRHATRAGGDDPRHRPGRGGPGSGAASLRGRRGHADRFPGRDPVLAVPALLEVPLGLRVDLPECQGDRGPGIPRRLLLRLPVPAAVAGDDLRAEPVLLVGQHDPNHRRSSEVPLQPQRAPAGQLLQRCGDLDVAAGALDAHGYSVAALSVRTTACVARKKGSAAPRGTWRRSAARSGSPPRGAAA